jgi:hypothetical protein
VSTAEVVENPVTVNEEPETQSPVFLALAFTSSAGLEPSTTLVCTVAVEAVPEVVVKPLQRVPQVPTVVLFVKKV